MKLKNSLSPLKPPESLLIFSIDIHPDGSRFATGGQGDNCGRVAIWNMSPLLNRDDEHNENVPKQLCRLDNHQSCVNCVRWSNSGRYLASAGDDKVIMIWQFAGQGGVAFGGVTNAESWRCCNSLRGHSGDILDLNWSPNDSYLATCSVDNTIRVWNAENFPECLKIISGHSGFVKGVSWDPMGECHWATADGSPPSVSTKVLFLQKNRQISFFAIG